MAIIYCPGLSCIFIVEANDKDGNHIYRTIRATDSRRARERFESHYGTRLEHSTVTVKRL